MLKRLAFAFALSCALPAFGQTAGPISLPKPVFVDNTGLICSGCKLYTYASGTSTPQATYTDTSGSTQNSNPVVMGPDGTPENGGQIWLGSSPYKFVLTSSTGSTIWTIDGVPGSVYTLLPLYLPLAGGTLTGALNGLTANFSGTISAASFTGAGTGLTGTAGSLSIGGNAATATTATHANNLPADFATQSAAGASTGKFTTATVTDLEGAVGGVTPAAGTFTTLQANTSLKVNGSQAFTGVQGTTGLNLAAATGSFTNGHLRSTDASGNEVDAGVSVPATFSGGSSYTFPGGLIIKTGLADSASSSFAVSFSPAFPNAVLSVTFGTGNFGTNASRNVCYIDSSAPTTSGFTAKTDSTTVHCYWTAIGW